MMIKADLIQAIKTLVDSRGEQWTRLGLSSSGYAWGTDKGMDAILEAIVDAHNNDGIALKDKVNELVDQYNQLLTDYNNSTIPSTAQTIRRI